jgi:hypothetical protein
MNEFELEEKVADVLASPLDVEVESDRIFDRLATDLHRYALHLTGNDERDIDSIEVEVDGTDAVYVGSCWGFNSLILVKPASRCAQRRGNWTSSKPTGDRLVWISATPF